MQKKEQSVLTGSGEFDGIWASFEKYDFTLGQRWEEAPAHGGNLLKQNL